VIYYYVRELSIVIFFPLEIVSLFQISLPFTPDIMAKARSGFFDRAEEKGSELDRADIDGKPAHNL
jgi:hypothetical protein